MREGEISFCNERRTEVVSCFRQGEMTRRGLHAMGEGLALILTHSYLFMGGKIDFHLMGMLLGNNTSRNAERV